MATKLFREGITVKELINELQKLPDNTPVYPSSDEEQNTLFKGMYLDVFSDGVIMAGLSGLELGEDY